MVEEAQDTICQAVEALDGTSFHEDRWVRPEGGSGRTRVLQDGCVFEKAGVNSSVLHGTLPAAMAKLASSNIDKGLGHEAYDFFAAGVSLILHPHNPMAPTFHASFRYFELLRDGEPITWWFGGGADITPAYVFEEDVVHFHGMFKDVCDRHDPAFYPQFKKNADDYFYLPHRGERRGLGGILFNNMNDRPKEALFAFVKECAHTFVPASMPIIARRKDQPFTEQQKAWQAVRRSRYVEFNLLYDRGTIFGLKMAVRPESILVSMPRTAQWEYNQDITPGSPEAVLLDLTRTPKDWV